MDFLRKCFSDDSKEKKMLETMKCLLAVLEERQESIKLLVNKLHSELTMLKRDQAKKQDDGKLLGLLMNHSQRILELEQNTYSLPSSKEVLAEKRVLRLRQWRAKHKVTLGVNDYVKHRRTKKCRN